MHDLELRVLQFIEEQRLCPAGSRVLVACSGGADSLALLEILHRLSDRLKIQLGAITIDHRQYRGFCRAVELTQRRCLRHGLPFLLRSLSDSAPGESETALRRRRYRLLEATAREEGWQFIATAHQLDDQVETALLRLLRGTGVVGLAAMAPRRGVFIRPLLCARRAEITAYLKSRRLRWWQDPANLKLRFPRNRIRHRLLPLLEREFNPAVRQAILRLVRAAARERELMDALAQRVPLQAGEGRSSVRLEELRRLHPALQAHVLRRLAALVHPEAAGLLEERVEEVLERLAAGERSFSLSLGEMRQCIVHHGLLTIGYGQPAAASFSYLIEAPGELRLEETGKRLSFNLLARGKKLPAADTSLAYFDADEIRFPLLVRSLKPGDRLEPWGQTGSHKVARLLMEEKIPRADRWRVPLVLCGEKILWVAGVRRSRHAPVSERTRRLLVARLGD
jgi:tRNA(Ile)-lysidine synthase